MICGSGSGYGTSEIGPLFFCRVRKSCREQAPQAQACSKTTYNLFAVHRICNEHYANQGQRIKINIDGCQLIVFLCIPIYSYSIFSFTMKFARPVTPWIRNLESCFPLISKEESFDSLSLHCKAIPLLITGHYQRDNCSKIKWYRLSAHAFLSVYFTLLSDFLFFSVCLWV